MQKRKILIIESGSWNRLTKEDCIELERYSDAFDIIRKSGEITIEDIKDVEIIYGPIKKDMLVHAKKLKWLTLMSAGANGYEDYSLYTNKDIVLCNSSGVFGVPIAEYILGGVLSFYRGFHLARNNQLKGQWGGLSVPFREVSVSTIGIIGLGDIGYETAKRFKAMGARVLAVKRHITQQIDNVDRLYDNDGIDEVLKQSDVVVLTLPLTKETTYIIDARRLELMKEDAIIVNVGRGALIDQGALIRVLEEQKIGGAILDVTTPEPLPVDNKLWKFENVIITPHFSWGSRYTNRRRVDIFLKNLENYTKGLPLDNKVDFTLGY